MFLEKNSNLGAIICRIWVIPVTSVLSVVNDSDSYSKIVTLVNGSTWKEIYITPGTAELSQKMKDSDAGVIYEQILKFIFPGDDSTTPGLLDGIMNRPLVVLLQQSDDQYRLIGSPDNGARMQANLQSGQKASGREIIISCNASEPSWWDNTSNYPPAS